MTKTGGKIKGVETNMKTLQNALFKTKEKLDGKDEEIKNISRYSVETKSICNISIAIESYSKSLSPSHFVTF